MTKQKNQYYKKIGDHFRALRERGNWSQVDVGQLIDVDPKRIWAIENGVNAPAQVLSRLCNLFNEDPEQWLEVKKECATFARKKGAEKARYNKRKKLPNKYERLGDALKEKREQRHLNQKEVELKTGLPRHTLSGMESGKYMPENHVVKLAKFYGVDPNFWLKVREDCELAAGGKRKSPSKPKPMPKITVSENGVSSAKVYQVLINGEGMEYDSKDEASDGIELLKLAGFEVQSITFNMVRS